MHSPKPRLGAHVVELGRKRWPRNQSLEARLSRDSFRFHALIGPPGCEVLVFFRPAAGPFDYQTIDLVSLPQPEGYRQFRLRQITGPALDQARLARSSVKDLRRRPDGIAIRLRSDQMNPNASVPGRLVVTVKIGGAVVGGDEQIKIAVAIKIAVGKAA